MSVLRDALPEVHLVEPSGYAGVFQHTWRLGEGLHRHGRRVVLHTGHEHEDVHLEGVELCPCSWWPRRAGNSKLRSGARQTLIARRFVQNTRPRLARCAPAGSVLQLEGIAATGAMNLARHNPPSCGVRDIVRRWPLNILPALVAVTAGLVSASQQAPSYSATTLVEVLPLLQDDKTFLGTSLLRDASDANLTAATTAAVLDSRRTAVSAKSLGDGWTPETVAGAVRISAVPNTNVIEIVATAADPNRAQRLSESFAKATLADRWKKIAAELGGQIAAIGANPAPADASDAMAAPVQALKVTREAGSDPTIRVSSTSTAVRNQPMPVGLVIALTAAGGLVIGLLTVIGMLRLRRSRTTSPEAAPIQEPVPAYSMIMEN